jgi:hypothetical protein
VAVGRRPVVPLEDPSSRRTHDSNQESTAPGLPGFGNASIDVTQVKELARSRLVSDVASDLLAEISDAHLQLRELFAQGLDDAAESWPGA